MLTGMFWLLLAFFFAASAILAYHWRAYALEPKKMLVAAYLFFLVAFVLMFVQVTSLLALW